MKILLLEDDEIIASQIIDYFELFDHKVTHYINGEKLLQEANPTFFDIMILDINTPGMDGIELLKNLRELNINTPAIFITAMSSIDYLKEAFKKGAADYIKKPFDLEELEIRIDHILNQKDEMIKIDDSYYFDLKNQKLLFNQNEVKLNQNEKRFLYLLVRNKGEVVDKYSIKDYLWEDKEVCDNTLRTTIKKLRKKLKNDFIINVRGEGYKIE